MPNRSSHRALLFIISTAALAVSVLLVHRHVAVVVTPSLRQTLFILTSVSEQEIRRGDHVLFVLYHPLTRELGFSKTVKEVVCMGGDDLSVRGRDFYCNGVLLGRAKDRSLKGERVRQFRYAGIVPEGALFVMGHTIDSYDSRYFGFIDVGQVLNLAHPLI